MRYTGSVSKVMQFVFFQRSSRSKRIRTDWVTCGGLLATNAPKLNLLPWECQQRCFREPHVKGPVLRRAMVKTMEQHYVIKFCAKLNKEFADIRWMIRDTYRDSAIPHSQVSRWLMFFFKMARKRWRMIFILDALQAVKPTKMCLVIVIFKVPIVEWVFGWQQRFSVVRFSLLEILSRFEISYALCFNCSCRTKVHWLQK